MPGWRVRSGRRQGWGIGYGWGSPTAGGSAQPGGQASRPGRHLNKREPYIGA